MQSQRTKTIVELVSSERFARAWALLDAPEEMNRIPAFNGILRMLASKDLRMADVIDALKTLRPKETQDDLGQPMRPHPPEDAVRAHATRAYAHQAQATVRDVEAGRHAFLEEAAQALLSTSFVRNGGLRPVLGEHIPRTIVGTVEELGSRITPFGEVLSFAMRNGICVYGPIAALDPSTIERLRTGAESGARMRVDTLPRHGPLLHPSASRVSVSLA